MYYVEELHCPYEIHDNVLYYFAYTGKVYKREMCEEISRIINTLRSVVLKDGQKRFYKAIYENELVSINRYVMGTQPFKCDPEYYSVPIMNVHGEIIMKHGKPVMSGQILRYRGEVPNFANGKPVSNPTYFSREAVNYYISHKSKCPEQYWEQIQIEFKQLQKHQQQ